MHFFSFSNTHIVLTFFSSFFSSPTFHHAMFPTSPPSKLFPGPCSPSRPSQPKQELRSTILPYRLSTGGSSVRDSYLSSNPFCSWCPCSSNDFATMTPPNNNDNQTRSCTLHPQHIEVNRWLRVYWDSSCCLFFICIYKKIKKKDRAARPKIST